MARFVEWAQGVALSLGGPGLFIIAFLDSSFLSFPEVNDLLIVWLTIQHPERMLYYALMTTLGSIAGCLALYTVARKGGERFLRKRMQAKHIDWGMDVFRRYGLFAVLVPSVLPPPAPFKIFVVLAGVSRVKLSHFITAIAIGRGTRYFGEGLLAVLYGEAAITFLKENARTVAFIVGAVILAGGLAYIVWRQRRAGGESAA